MALNIGGEVAPTRRCATPRTGSAYQLSVASSRKYTTSSGEQREEVEWFNCSAFGKLAETCNQYLAKGKQVYVEGRLTSRIYQTQGGETRHSNDINVTQVEFLGQCGDSGAQDQAFMAEEYQEAGVDLPF